MVMGSFSIAEAQAPSSECRRQLDQARRRNSPNLVVTFEGLFGQELFGSPVKNHLMDPWIRSNGAVAVSHHGCTTSMFAELSRGCAPQVQSAMACLRIFQSEFGSRLNVSVIGHSFGASYGVFNFIKQAEREGVFIENVLTLDARTHHDDQATRGRNAPDPSMYRYERPRNVGRFINVYQCSGLRGYLVKNATNISLCGEASHLRLPAHPRVRQVADQLLDGQSAPSGDSRSRRQGREGTR